MTVSAQTSINGNTFGFVTDEPDKASTGIELLESLEQTCETLENILNGLKDLSDNYSEDDEEEDEDYVETEDDEELIDTAYEEGYDAGFEDDADSDNNPYYRGTPEYDAWLEGYHDGGRDYEWDNS